MSASVTTTNKRRPSGSPATAEKRRAYVAAFLGDGRFRWSTAARISGLARTEEQAELVGRRMRRCPEVRSLIEAALSDREVGRDVVLAELADIALGRTPGTKIRDRLRALEMLGKALGIWRPEGSTVSVVTSVGVQSGQPDLTRLTDAELEALNSLLTKASQPSEN